MIKLTVPGAETIELEHLVLDFNGTIATDGILISGVRDRIKQLHDHLHIYVVTADTNGSVHNECQDMPVKIHIIGQHDQAREKKRFVDRLPHGVVVVGNGRNDAEMFVQAALAIAVVGDFEQRYCR